MNDTFSKLVASGAGYVGEGRSLQREKRTEKKTTAEAGNAEGRWEGNACSLKRRGRQGGGMLKEAGRPHAENARNGSGSLP